MLCRRPGLPDLGHVQPQRPGRKTVLSDAELICLVVAQHLLHGHSSESRRVHCARTRLSGLFLGIPQQSGCTLRVRAAGTLISAVITALAMDIDSWHEVLRLLDSTPVPCGASRETVKRSDLAGDADYGYLRLAFALLLGREAPPGQLALGHAGDLVPGQPEAR